jgi:predicted lipoprotein with Yx(FWY)xxD motif
MDVSKAAAVLPKLTFRCARSSGIPPWINQASWTIFQRVWFTLGRVVLDSRCRRTERRRFEMRRLFVSLSAAFVVCTQSAAATESSVPNIPYPGAVALGQVSTDTWSYKSFPQLLPLYIFNGEPPGRSLCDRDCTAVWPIVRAERDDKAVGLWTVVKRDDGRFQWAYKNSPVYTYFEDRPNEPKGAGKNMDWYLDETGYAYLASVGVHLSPPPADAQARKGKKTSATATLLQP